ncbi:MAG: ABC transporter ATP-binding protein [Planctomycetes bacterium]|nr:ABC transporter ATP-binding protein [Planctomycetota bacterium]
MIHIEGVEFTYPGHAFRLRVPRMRVGAGERVAIVGPSGSGKTTLLHLIAGILVPGSGDVSVGGSSLPSMRETARRAFRLRAMGLVFQEFELIEHLNVLENILLPCRISPAVRLTPGHRERARSLARDMGIERELNRYVRRLSQGERQRVAMCRALVLEPPLLLCDEPTGNLDPVTKEHVLDGLFAQVARGHTTLVAVTHDHGLLSRFDATIDFTALQTGGAP